MSYYRIKINIEYKLSSSTLHEVKNCHEIPIVGNSSNIKYVSAFFCVKNRILNHKGKTEMYSAERY